MTLHLITRSPHESHAIKSCLQVLSEGDAVLLLDDGVLCLLDDEVARLGDVVYYLSDHAAIRSLWGSGAQHAIDYDGMVALTLQHNPIQTWA